MTGVSPADAIDGDTAGDVAEAAADHAGAEGAETDVGADDVGRPGGKLKDALLSTEPDLSPARVKPGFGGDEAAAHAYIGARKALAGLGFAGGDDDGGTPAIVHFAMAGFAHLTGRDDDDQEASDDDRDAGALEAGDEFVDPAGGGA